MAQQRRPATRRTTAELHPYASPGQHKSRSPQLQFTLNQDTPAIPSGQDPAVNRDTTFQVPTTEALLCVVPRSAAAPLGEVLPAWGSRSSPLPFVCRAPSPLVTLTGPRRLWALFAAPG